MKIFKEKAGVISKNSLWVCFHKEYMYTGSSILALIKQMVFEWNHERHIVG